MIMESVTQEWLECFKESKENGGLTSVFFRLTPIIGLPEGVDPENPEVIAAIEDIKIANAPK